ncbi:MAG TPA: hypothetical protein VK469_01640 [Candidatus Kapabacteria bacterium]|nr:hypothetical protein [Candidatus Kapabacteria bacterium]
MQKLKDIKQKILPVLEGGEVLIIVPPFVSIIDIALGPHTLQALAEEKGHKISILYLNMLLASIIGVEHYEEICNAPLYQMLGERLFARSAYGLSPLGNNPGCCTDEAMSIRSSEPHQKMFFDTPLPFDLDKYLQLERICQYFLDEVITVITSLDYKIIGCSTFMTGQINCSIALLNGVKQNHPGTITIIGGPNCKGEMSEGIASLSHAIDFIFSGESETTFLDFLEAYSLKKFPSQRIIKGEPLADLDSLPLPGYEIFSQQYGHFLGKSSFQRIKIWYETSRGCWWGQKSRCTFCSEDRLTYTVKSINKVVSDLERINKIYPGNMIYIADNIMPHSYQHDLLPVISQRKEFPSLAYHLKVNYNLQNLVQLKKARIRAILPGIETF